MKTKMIKTSEFIKMLQEEDPNDECYVCVGNRPVRFIENLPYYYDGRMEWVERDEHNHVIKAGYMAGVRKLKIHGEDLEDVLLEEPDVELELSGITYQGKVDSRYWDAIQAWRRDGLEYQEWRKKADEARKKGQPMPDIVIKGTPESLQNRIHTWLTKLGVKFGL